MYRSSLACSRESNLVYLYPSIVHALLLRPRPNQPSIPIPRTLAPTPLRSTKRSTSNRRSVRLENARRAASASLSRAASLVSTTPRRSPRLARSEHCPRPSPGPTSFHHPEDGHPVAVYAISVPTIPTHNLPTLTFRFRLIFNRYPSTVFLHATSDGGQSSSLGARALAVHTATQARNPLLSATRSGPTLTTSS